MVPYNFLAYKSKQYLVICLNYDELYVVSLDASVRVGWVHTSF